MKVKMVNVKDTQVKNRMRSPGDSESMTTLAAFQVVARFKVQHPHASRTLPSRDEATRKTIPCDINFSRSFRKTGQELKDVGSSKMESYCLCWWSGVDDHRRKSGSCVLAFW